MKSAAFRIALFLSVLWIWTTQAVAERRVALLIGNSDYASVTPLQNPRNDASVLAQQLNAIGFDKVTLRLDLNATQMRQALGKFARQAAGADIAVIYFAGHGIEVGGTNYVIPTDAKLSHVDDVEFEALQLSKLMRSVDRATKLKLVILDACRNNPFQQAMQGTGGNRSVGRGLVRVSPPGSDTLVAYAAKEGTLAADGDGRHSPYAAALIKHIASPGLDVRLLFGRVRDDVLASTGRRQEPFTYGSLGGNAIYLNSPDPVGSAGPGKKAEEEAQSSAAEQELAFWNTVKDRGSKRLLDLYLASYPSGTFATLAKAMLEEVDAAALQTKEGQGGQDGKGETEPKLQIPESVKLALAADNARLAQNHGEAARLYRQAAELGNVVATFNLAVLHESGQGVVRSYEEAARLYRIAAEAGDPDAMHNLAVLYDNGNGVGQSADEAVRWYTRAARMGHPSSLHSLGVAYALGSGVGQDQERASQFIFRALQEKFALTISKLTDNASAWQPQFWRALQRRLRNAGVYAGPVNGRFGPATHKAIEALAGRS